MTPVEIMEKAGVTQGDIWTWTVNVNYIWVFGPGVECKFNTKYLDDEAIVRHIKGLINC